MLTNYKLFKNKLFKNKNMLNLWVSDSTSLGEKAKQLVIDFHKKKASFIKEWVKELVEIVKKEILLGASLGETSTYFNIEQYIYDLKPFSVELGGISRSYTISTKDKNNLISQLNAIYSNKKSYPDIEVRLDDFGTGLLIYWS